MINIKELVTFLKIMALRNWEKACYGAAAI